MSSHQRSDSGAAPRGGLSRNSLRPRLRPWSAVPVAVGLAGGAVAGLLTAPAGEWWARLPLAAAGGGVAAPAALAALVLGRQASGAGWLWVRAALRRHGLRRALDSTLAELAKATAPELDGNLLQRAAVLQLLLDDAVASFQAMGQAKGAVVADWAGCNNAGVALAIQGRTDEARGALFQAAERGGETALVELNIAALRLRGRRYKSALSHLTKAAERRELTAGQRHLQACLQWTCGQTETAMATFQEALAGGLRQDPTVLANMGVLLAARGTLGRAGTVLTAALDRRPGSVEARVNRGLVRWEQGRQAAAMRDFTLAVRRAPDNDRVLLAQGLGYHATGQYRRAARRFREAARRQPRRFEAFYNLALTLLAEGHPAEAQEAIGQALALDRNHPAGLICLGAVEFALDRLELAEEAWSEAAASQHDHRDLVRHNLGLVYAVTGRVRPALQMFDGANGLAPDNPAHERGRAYALHLAGELEQAHDAHRRLALRTRAAIDRYHTGLCDYALGRERDAIDSFSDALRLDSGCYQAHFPLGCVHAQLGHSEAALHAWERGLEHEPESPELLSNLGLAYYRTKQTAKAIELLQRAWILRPNDADACNNLALANAQAERFDRAVEYLEKAVSLQPDSAVTRCNLGLAYYLTERVELALEQWSQVSRVDPLYYTRRQADLQNSFDDVELRAMPLDWQARVIPHRPLTAPLLPCYLIQYPEPCWQVVVRDAWLADGERVARWQSSRFTVHREASVETRAEHRD